MRIHLPDLLLLAITCTAGAQTPFAPPLPTAPTYTSDPKFVAAMAQAKQLKHEHQYSFAIDALRKANKAAVGACLYGHRTRRLALQPGRDGWARRPHRLLGHLVRTLQPGASTHEEARRAVRW